MTPIYMFLLPSIEDQPEVSTLTKLRSIDWVGAVLSSAVYVTFVMIFTFGGSIWPWDGGRMIALYVVCGATAIGFAVTQYFVLFTTKERRLFPGHFLRDRTLVLLFICSTCLGGALFTTIYYLPLFFQFVRGDNGVQAAVRLLPFICFYVFGVVCNGYFMLRWGYYMPWFLGSGILLTIGGALLYTSSMAVSNATIYGYSILVGIGLTAYQAAYSVAPAKVRPDEVPDVLQFINIAQQGSTLIALTISNTVFQNVAFEKLMSLLIPAGYSEADVTAAIAGAKSTVLESAPPAVRQAALDVLVGAIDDAYTLIFISGALLVICSVFMKREKVTMELVAGG